MQMLSSGKKKGKGKQGTYVNEATIFWPWWIMLQHIIVGWKHKSICWHNKEHNDYCNFAFPSKTSAFLDWKVSNEWVLLGLQGGYSNHYCYCKLCRIVHTLEWEGYTSLQQVKIRLGQVLSHNTALSRSLWTSRDSSMTLKRWWFSKQIHLIPVHALLLCCSWHCNMKY